MAKITTLFTDWCRSLNLEKGDYLTSIEREDELERHAP